MVKRSGRKSRAKRSGRKSRAKRSVRKQNKRTVCNKKSLKSSCKRSKSCNWVKRKSKGKRKHSSYCRKSSSGRPKLNITYTKLTGYSPIIKLNNKDISHMPQLTTSLPKYTMYDDNQGEQFNLKLNNISDSSTNSFLRDMEHARVDSISSHLLHQSKLLQQQRLLQQHQLLQNGQLFDNIPLPPAS
tara:strand:+ start:71 stop:628 length:558 start_codon:yes stop_codon:yes gene_type:complete